MKKTVDLLDCTLRDGSYVIDYQFTAEDTFVVSRALSQAGVPYVEVGHGVGLDAQYKGSGRAAESDICYIEAAKAGAEGNTKVGVFYIPEIGELESIRKAADAGLDFIRIGTNVYESEKAKASVELAKSLGLEVSSNLMKSYVVPPSQLVENCQILEDFGVDTICLVDSAGGMTPNEVRAYMSAMKNGLSTRIGFHGHNNLELAIANCLVAIEEGADIVDGSLMGMGRSAGNASTNILASLLSREGYDLGSIDWQMLMRIAGELIVPLMPLDKGMGSEKLASGLSYFHSSYTKVINKFSRQYGVPSYETILNLKEESRVEVTEKIAEEAAIQASAFARELPRNSQTSNSVQIKTWKSIQPSTVKELLNTMKEFTSKTGSVPVLTVARSKDLQLKSFKISPIRIGNGFCVGHVETSIGAEVNLFTDIQGRVSQLMVDRVIEVPTQISDDITVVSYDDDALTKQTLCDFMRLYPGLKTFYLSQLDKKNDTIGLQNLKLYKQFSDTDVDIGIAISSQNKFKLGDVARIRDGGILLLVHAGSAGVEVVKEARNRKLSIHRLDLSEALLGEVARTFGMIDRLDNHAGKLSVEETEIVAGGIVGEPGSVVVNSLKKPTQIHGLADGYGGLSPFCDLMPAKQDSVLKWMSGKLDY